MTLTGFAVGRPTWARGLPWGLVAAIRTLSRAAGLPHDPIDPPTAYKRRSGHAQTACRTGGHRLIDPCIAAQQTALVRAIALERDRAAFAELFDYYAPRIKGFLMRGGCPAEEADEVSQETMLTMWRKAAYYDPARASVSTWLYTIARNLRVDAARRRVHESLDDAEMPADIAQPGIEVAAATRQRERRVHQALERLPEDQARVVLLAFFAGQSHSALAVELALPLGTVKSRLRLALDKLRAALQDLGE